jgi:hypothetical protein
MKKTLAALALIALAGAALATTTWTAVTTDAAGKPLPNYVRAVKGWNPTATGTEPAPVTSTVSTDGLDLRNLQGLSFEVETCSSVCTLAGGNMTAGGKLNAYLWNPVTGKWLPVSDGSLDLTVAAVPGQSFSGFTVTGDYSRIAMEPNGLGTSSATYIYGIQRVAPTDRYR